MPTSIFTTNRKCSCTTSNYEEELKGHEGNNQTNSEQDRCYRPKQATDPQWLSIETRARCPELFCKSVWAEEALNPASHCGLIRGGWGMFGVLWDFGKPQAGNACETLHAHRKDCQLKAPKRVIRGSASCPEAKGIKGCAHPPLNTAFTSWLRGPCETGYSGCVTHL